MVEDVGVAFQRGLAEWWSEETEYILQRIERWAAYARGYNRLRSQRLSKGRMTMREGREPTWSISSNKLIIDDPSWSPRFHALKRSRRVSARPEETKINCCGTFNYQSNSNLDSSCLETYRYDHSIYFKTIGDIKNSKKASNGAENEQDRISISSEELVEWDVNTVSDFIANQLLEDRFTGEGMKNVWDAVDSDQVDANQVAATVTWFNVDLRKLDLNQVETNRPVVDQLNNESQLTDFVNEEESNNNNYAWNEESFADENWKNRTGLRYVVADENNVEYVREGDDRFIGVRQTGSTVGKSWIVNDNEGRVFSLN